MPLERTVLPVGEFMKTFAATFLLTIVTCCFCISAAKAQSPATTGETSAPGESVPYAEDYLVSKISSLERYLDRSQRIQKRMLKKLKQAESKLAASVPDSLKNKFSDSEKGALNADSIAARSSDSATLRRLAQKKNKIVDSLKGVQSFLGAQLSKAGDMAGNVNAEGYTEKLNKLQEQLNLQEQVNGWMQQRQQSLGGFANAHSLPVMGKLQKLQSQALAARQKIKYWKELADDPDKAEEEAWEYLNGIEGFDKYLSQNETPAFGGLGNNATAADLERMGYQTKRQTAAMLQEQFGDHLGGVQQQMGAQIKEYTDQLNDIQGKAAEAKAAVSEAKGKVKEAGAQARQLKAPSLKNPLNGIPFWQRWDWDYNFQTTRAGADGVRPAMMDLGATAVFKHTPKISYGIGLATAIGLGQDWQHLRLSYEGITARIYADGKLAWGFSLQGGYEKSLRPAGRNYLSELQQSGEAGNVRTAMGILQDAAYLGIMKQYRVSKKWNGTMLVGYNFLWQQSGLRSPWMVRLGWSK